MRLLDAAGWVALALALACATLVILPLEPEYLYPDLDGSFAATLHWAEMHRGEPGVRLIHTYGPLGFAHYGLYLPETFRSLVLWRIAFAIVLCWPLAWLGRAATGSPWGGALTVAAAAPFLGYADVRGVLPPLLAVLAWLAPRRPPPWLQIVLGIALALVALTKITFLVLAVVALLPGAAEAVVPPRRVPWMAMVMVASTVIVWTGFGFGASDAIAFLDWSLREIAPGYAQGAQLPPTLALVTHAVAAALVLWLAAAWASRRTFGGRTVPLLALALLLYLVFKVGFVRADVHVFITIEAFFIVAVLLAALCGGSRPLRVLLAVASLAALPATLLWHAVPSKGFPSGPYRIASPSELEHRLRTLPALLDPTPFAAMHNASLTVIRAGQTLPPLDGPVDVYTIFQARVLGHDLAFRPRPVFQSYFAYTPRLAHANADFLTGESAPRWVFFQPGTLDNRLPAMDDAPSWPLLLSRYEPVSMHGSLMLLGRRDTPLPWRIVPLSEVETTTEAPVEVPADGPIWARIEVHETLVDRIASAALAAPALWLVATYADGSEQRLRLIAGIARDGFLLSPVVDNAARFVALIPPGEAPPAARLVKRMRVETESPLGTPRGPRRMTVNFGRLEIGPIDPPSSE